MTSANIEDLKSLERLIASLPEEKKKELSKLSVVKDEMEKMWLPNPGPQTDAYYCEADELFYGGQAGGGKSDLLMGLSLTAHRQSLLLRRTNKEASKFIKRFSEIVGHRDGWNGQLGIFNFPDGRSIEMGGCQLEDDKQKYKGDPHDLIGFDEIADFTESQFRFIKGWNRSAKKGQRVRLVAAGNPPTKPEGIWVTKYWGAWLDPNHPKFPTPEGQLRWYTTIGGEDVEVDGRGPHQIPGEPKPVMARSRTFIRSTLDDNPDLEEQGYDSVLAAHPKGLREAYRDGRFDVVFEDDAWQVIPTAWIVAAQERWQPNGWRELEMTAMGLDPSGSGQDPATLAPRYGTWFGEIHEVKGSDAEDGSAMAGLVIKHRKNNCPIIVDVGGGYAGSVITRFKDNDIDYYRFNGSQKSMSSANGSGLKFHNRRAEIHWRFREALDPDQEGGSVIALPPDTELKAELAAARYELGPRGIKIEDKDKIRERIGRSPNKSDAVMMCLSEGDKAARRRATGGLFGRAPKVLLGYANAKTKYGKRGR